MNQQKISEAGGDALDAIGVGAFAERDWCGVIFVESANLAEKRFELVSAHRNIHPMRFHDQQSIHIRVLLELVKRTLNGGDLVLVWLAKCFIGEKLVKPVRTENVYEWDPCGSLEPYCSWGTGIHGSEIPLIVIPLHLGGMNGL